MIKNKYQFINLDYLELMADGDSSMKKLMLGMLMDELPTELTKMRQFLVEKNWNELGNVSHKMKSTLAYVGNNSMTIINKTIETVCKSGENLNDLNSLITDLELNFNQIFPELTIEINSL